MTRSLILNEDGLQNMIEDVGFMSDLLVQSTRSLICTLNANVLEMAQIIQIHQVLECVGQKMSVDLDVIMR